eukprot:m.35056 g.35056  ORF g.35056 m.35056 type:complete len:710 (+) comp14373_c0_seq1:745-2874(+)
MAPPTTATHGWEDMVFYQFQQRFVDAYLGICIGVTQCVQHTTISALQHEDQVDIQVRCEHRQSILHYSDYLASLPPRVRDALRLALNGTTTSPDAEKHVLARKIIQGQFQHGVPPTPSQTGHRATSTESGSTQTALSMLACVSERAHGTAATESLRQRLDPNFGPVSTRAGAQVQHGLNAYAGAFIHTVHGQATYGREGAHMLPYRYPAGYGFALAEHPCIPYTSQPTSYMHRQVLPGPPGSFHHRTVTSSASGEQASKKRRQSDDELYVPSLKNFEFQGKWVQYHNCGSHGNNGDHNCMVCRKENAKLANSPLQPMDHCSPNCAKAFDTMRRNDARPPEVIALLKHMQSKRSRFKKKPSFDGKGGKMYITLQDIPHAYALIQRTKIDAFRWQYRYYYHRNVRHLPTPECPMRTGHQPNVSVRGSGAITNVPPSEPLYLDPGCIHPQNSTRECSSASNSEMGDAHDEESDGHSEATHKPPPARETRAQPMLPQHSSAHDSTVKCECVLGSGTNPGCSSSSKANLDLPKHEPSMRCPSRSPCCGGGTDTAPAGSLEKDVPTSTITAAMALNVIPTEIQRRSSTAATPNPITPVLQPSTTGVHTPCPDVQHGHRTMDTATTAASRGSSRVPTRDDGMLVQKVADRALMIQSANTCDTVHPERGHASSPYWERPWQATSSARAREPDCDVADGSDKKRRRCSDEADRLLNQL